ncbi:alpha/beta hydrolase [Erythrobacter sp. HKB08]|uniref:alpha/beta hydrolase n=1 Tax=Erythrobacter sp. HKB08 TaxID=2502843 RepID=UPI001F3C978B|nr:alpha/beta hydrolase [Erythrobacter sp. HKB08]
MSKQGRRKMWLAIVSVALVVVAGFIGLQVAIARNGPAVVDTVDRISGGGRGVAQAHKASFGPSDAQKLIVYAPEQADEPLPVIIFSHGGSWRSGDPDDYGFLARGLVPEGFVVVLAGYRLHPEAVFPAMLEDTASTIAWTRDNIARYGGDPDAIFLAGHSAGAYNVVMTTLDPQWLAAEGLDDDAVRGVIGLAGPYDFYPFDGEATRASFGDAENAETSTQPIAFARGDAPPMLLMSGESDAVVRPRNSRVLAERIEELGGRAETLFFEETDHYDILLRTASPWRRDARVIAAIRDFAKPLASRSPAPAAAETSVPVQAQTR